MSSAILGNDIHSVHFFTKYPDKTRWFQFSLASDPTTFLSLAGYGKALKDLDIMGILHGLFQIDRSRIQVLHVDCKTSSKVRKLMNVFISGCVGLKKVLICHNFALDMLLGLKHMLLLNDQIESIVNYDFGTFPEGMEEAIFRKNHHYERISVGGQFYHRLPVNFKAALAEVKSIDELDFKVCCINDDQLMQLLPESGPEIKVLNLRWSVIKDLSRFAQIFIELKVQEINLGMNSGVNRHEVYRFYEEMKRRGCTNYPNVLLSFPLEFSNNQFKKIKID